MQDPFEDGKSYEVEGIVVDIKKDIQRVRIKSKRGVSWLPIDEIIEIKNPDSTGACGTKDR
jgi:hypothetical protein